MLWLLLACGPEPEPSGRDDTDVVGDDDDDDVFVDPFAAQPDDSQGLVNVSADLEELLEHGALEGACDAWLVDPNDRRKKLLCGKEMFFYEGFDTIGIPTALLDFMGNKMPPLGASYTNLGLIDDPYGPEGRALGFGVGAPLEGDIETQALTCASCHFGQLPDGRYAVGHPNHDYDYGRHMLALFLAPNAVAPGFDPADHNPAAVAKVQPLLDYLDANPFVGIQMGLELLPLLGAQDAVPPMSLEDEGHYASWPPGTMDFVIAPLPLDDGVHTVSKILPLYGIPDAAEEADAGMPHAMLAWTGAAVSLEQFLGGFVRIGAGDEDTWTEERLSPLADYIRSLRPPEVDAGDVSAGEAVFREQCLDCHGGPRGSGLEVYDFDTIGTDDAMALWGDPEGTGALCCGLGDEPVTGGIKSPRLVGLWGMGRYLHNGSLTSLEQLLCLEDRPPSHGDAMDTVGHEFGCELPKADREDLIDYLEAH